jgi:uncharacterized UPF0160 family protein
MSIFKKKKILVTHNGAFHADDIFATAVVSIVFSGNIKVIRTRDQRVIAKADVVYDVGGIYDEEKNLFDHHQVGGAGARENGIPYSSFGLIWKKYGEKICGDKELAKKIDNKLVEPIDANDNGINLAEVRGSIAPYLIQDMFFAFRPSWKEEQVYDSQFKELVKIAEKIILREVKKMKDVLEAESIIDEIYKKAEDKRTLIFDDNYPWLEIINNYKEPLYVISKKDNLWRAEAVRKERYVFETRKPFPASWAGKRDEEMAKISGVSDAIFCHNGRFLVVAKSKEGVLSLVKKAIES